jgi:hypothetical protein
VQQKLEQFNIQGFFVQGKKWNDGREGISAYMLEITQHRDYHYKQE